MKINIVEFTHFPIHKQLQLEEALLRADTENWCVINQGSPPAIVMGISGKRETLINEAIFQQKPIPIIRRFSGGGTVVIDENTLFITLICNGKETVDTCYPQAIHQWVEKRYLPLFQKLPFKLQENDYTLGDRKFGGNAQYIRKDRWLHHSSLLWDFTSSNMDYLTVPPKIPEYREKRPHDDFLCRLNKYFACQNTFVETFKKSIGEKFQLMNGTEKIDNICERPHRKATVFL